MNARTLGVIGGLLGIAAGLTQATVGDRIPEWTGAKQAPVPLGLLTIALSLIAVLAAIRQRDPGLPLGTRIACAAGLLVPALLCLSTVGRLWYLPAALLLTAAAMTITNWSATAAALARNWWRVLLGLLGGCELLMAAGAAPGPMVAGAIGGTALIVAAWLTSRRWGWALVLIGTIPFAALAWTAAVPLLLTLEALAVFAVITRLDRRLS